MALVRALIALLTFGILGNLAHAGISDGVLCTYDDPCSGRGLFSKASPGPTKSDAIRLNPAAVPTEEVTGIEAIYFNSFDFALVKGLGRVGAAISPSNNEETFFGAPGVETEDAANERKLDRKKFDSTKYTLATGLNVFSTRGRGLLQTNFDIGVMGRYNKETGGITPGVGVRLTAGPLLAGASIYSDENTYATTDPANPRAKVRSNVKTWNAGVFLDSVLVDYSVIETEGITPARASVLTGALFVGKRGIITLAHRKTKYFESNYELIPGLNLPRKERSDMFLGVQYRVAKFLVLGIHHNYYLLDEFSGGIVLFF